MKTSLIAVMMAVALIVVSASIWYLGYRTSTFFGCRWWIPTLVYLMIMVAISGVMTFSMSGHDGSMGGHLLVASANILLGVLMILLMSSLAVEIVGVVVKMSPKVFGIVVCVLTTILTATALSLAAMPKIKRVETQMAGLSHSVEIVQLSDIHLGHFRGSKHLEDLVDKVLATNAEACVITGDLFDSRYNYSPQTIEPLRRLTNRIPTLFVNGNHDIYTDDRGIKEALRGVGVVVLENEVAELGGVQIVGLNYMSGEANSFMHSAPRPNETVENTLPTIPFDREQPTILLHHNPVGCDAAERAGIDLYLAGHTHGGQLFPVTLYNDIMFGYNRGAYQLGGMKIYVSVGSGTFSMPMRLGTRSEITLHRLVPTK